MRILHILDHSVPLHSGYSFRTLALLREQRALGWKTMHLTSPRQGFCKAGQEEVDGMTFVRTSCMSNFKHFPVLRELLEMSCTLRMLWRLTKEFQPHVLHVHSPVLNAYPAFFIGLIRGLPVVYEIRAFWEDAAVDIGHTREGSLRYRITRWLETIAARRAQAVTTICQGLRNDLIKRGIDPFKIAVIPNAVDLQEFFSNPPTDPTLVEKLNLRGKTVLAFIGSFYAYEGLELLIEAAAQLKNRRGDFAVLLVGGGPMEQSWRELSRKLGVEDLVRFVGRVPHDQVAKYYGLAQIMVYPRNRMRLTDLVTPLKPLEAMAQNRLVLASDVGGHRELINDGKTGLLFPAGDSQALAAAIDRLLTTPDQWSEIAASGRKFVEQERTWTRSAQNYIPLFNQLYRHTIPARA